MIPGTMNNPGTVILEIAELRDTMEVEAEVDETDVVGMHDRSSAPGFWWTPSIPKSFPAK
ncbi:MAG: hypothetical protein R3E12_06100 [Candidatus Eisenbacteria bacterium]